MDSLVLHLKASFSCHELFLGSFLNPVQYFNTMCKAQASELGTELKVGKNVSHEVLLLFHVPLRPAVQNNTFEY